MKSEYVYEKAGYDRFMLSETLSFGMMVMHWSSGLMDVIKVMISEVNSIACIVGALPFLNKN